MTNIMYAFTMPVNNNDKEEEKEEDDHENYLILISARHLNDDQFFLMTRRIGMIVMVVKIKMIKIMMKIASY